MYLLVDQITEYIIYPNPYKFLYRVHRQGGSRYAPSPAHHHQAAGGRRQGVEQPAEHQVPRAHSLSRGRQRVTGVLHSGLHSQGSWGMGSTCPVLSCEMGVKHSWDCVSTLPHSDPGCVSLSDERTSLILAVPTDKTGTSCVCPLPRGGEKILATLASGGTRPAHSSHGTPVSPWHTPVLV